MSQAEFQKYGRNRLAEGKLPLVRRDVRDQGLAGRRRRRDLRHLPRARRRPRLRLRRLGLGHRLPAQRRGVTEASRRRPPAPHPTRHRATSRGGSGRPFLVVRAISGRRRPISPLLRWPQPCSRSSTTTFFHAGTPGGRRASLHRRDLRGDGVAVVAAEVRRPYRAGDAAAVPGRPGGRGGIGHDHGCRSCLP